MSGDAENAYNDATSGARSAAAEAATPRAAGRIRQTARRGCVIRAASVGWRRVEASSGHWMQERSGTHGTGQRSHPHFQPGLLPGAHAGQRARADACRTRDPARRWRLHRRDARTRAPALWHRASRPLHRAGERGGRSGAQPRHPACTRRVPGVARLGRRLATVEARAAAALPAAVSRARHGLDRHGGDRPERARVQPRVHPQHVQHLRTVSPGSAVSAERAAAFGRAVDGGGGRRGILAHGHDLFADDHGQPGAHLHRADPAKTSISTCVPAATGR